MEEFGRKYITRVLSGNNCSSNTWLMKNENRKVKFRQGENETEIYIVLKRKEQ